MWSLIMWYFVINSKQSFWSFTCKRLSTHCNQMCLTLRDNCKPLLFKNRMGEWSLDQISLDIFSWSKFSVKLGVWLKLLFFYFGQLIEFHLIFSVDRNFLKAQNTIIRTFDQLPKFASYFLAVDQNFNNVILSYFKLSIKCQKITCKFFHLIKSF